MIQAKRTKLTQKAPVAEFQDINVLTLNLLFYPFPELHANKR